MERQRLDELDQARQSFLAKLPPNYQGMACNFFLEPPRARGIDEPVKALKETKAIVQERLLSVYPGQSRNNLEALWQCIEDDPTGALILAEWAIAYVALPDDQRQARKTQQRAVWATESMRGKPATPKQLDYLKKLGYDGEVTDRRHASDLINNLIRS